VLGCAGDDAPSEDEGSDEPPAPPSILLAVPELEVSADRIEDITLEVENVRPGTRVELDGQSWLPGGAAPAAIEGSAEDEGVSTLRLPLGGAMVVGTHELSLVHHAGSEELRSETVTIQVVASSPGVLAASLDPEVVDVGDGLIAHGQGSVATFGVIDELAGVVRVRAGQWSAPGFELELPGLLAGAGAGLEASAWAELAIASFDEVRWVILTWLAEDGRAVYGRTIEVDGLGVPVAPVDDASEPLLLWHLDDPEQAEALGPHELARFEAVALLDRMVVLAIEARRDAEQATIGDHLLVTRWLAASGEPAPAVLLRGPASRDLDLPADARLWTYAGHGSALSVRASLAFPWLLTVASNGLPSLAEDPGELLGVPAAARWMTCGEGALGSRHCFAVNEGAGGETQLRVLRINRWSGQAEQPTEDPTELVDVHELPAWPGGAPRLGLLDGVPTLLVPMGASEDALALRSTGEASTLEPVAQLRCDELALAGPGFDGVGDTLPLACLLAGELRMGTFSVD
jgi:hypothetical protein